MLKKYADILMLLGIILVVNLTATSVQAQQNGWRTVTSASGSLPEQTIGSNVQYPRLRPQARGEQNLRQRFASRHQIGKPSAHPKLKWLSVLISRLRVAQARPTMPVEEEILTEDDIREENIRPKAPVLEVEPSGPVKHELFTSSEPLSEAQ